MATTQTMQSLDRPPQPRPEIGQNLIVIHDFLARSPDELTLLKGDIVELIERDDDFGDGWYLGRHVKNSNNGLFPQVYTRIAMPGTAHAEGNKGGYRIAPGGGPSKSPAAPTTSVPQPGIALTTSAASTEPPSEGVQPTPPVLVESLATVVTSEAEQTSSIARYVVPGTSGTPTVTPPLNTPTTPIVLVEPNRIPTPTDIPSVSLPNVAMTSAANSHLHGQDSPVMNETLSVIDEHITGMNAPHHGGVVDRKGANDSGSEYSSQLDPRLSYINGHETDEEEDDIHTKGEVLSWNADQVATFLTEAGVEPKHCEVFRDQEITGEVVLGMDQTSVFLKEFDLGSVGRRLKTWQKIKALQDEVNGESSTRRNTASYGSDIGSDDAGRNRSRSEASTFATAATSLPRVPTVGDRPTSRQNTRLSQQKLSRNNTIKQTPSLSSSIPDSPRPAGEKRPSAASIRDLHHSRQSSATEMGMLSPKTTLTTVDGASLNVQEGHKKQPSFDRNWTMGDALTPPLSTPLPGRPLSSSGVGGLKVTVADHDSQSILDRGYLSGGEVEGRQRNVLRKRAGSSTTHHSRTSSYTDEQRVRSATTHSRHSRFGSADSVRDSKPPSASQKYYGLSVNNRSSRRTPSENSINAPPRPPPPPKDYPSPTTNKLQGTPYETAMGPTASRPGGVPDWLAPSKPSRFGLRAISDAVTGHERSKITSPPDSLPSSIKDKEPIDTPSTRTRSSTPSGGQSLDLDAPGDKGSSGMVQPGTSRTTAKKKSKKETSAYTRGLEKKTPKEQMVGADYSGWMKKKSSNLMATWKPRLFILKGRRLSYYYSEDDTEERGLIDISFHKVLPAGNERLTGLHATLTGATNSPANPPGGQETAAEKDAILQGDLRAGSDSMFIFKLQPPKAGLARAVNFTKPTVHYFAVPNIMIGRLWMAALVKATIDRDDTKAVVTTYQQKTISLEKARKMRHRPPALMNLDEHIDEESLETSSNDKQGLNMQGVIFDQEAQERDSVGSGVSRPERALESVRMSNGASSSNSNVNGSVNADGNSNVSANGNGNSNEGRSEVEEEPKTA